MNSTATTQVQSERLSLEAKKIIGVVVLAPFMSQMDSTVVNVSMTAITQDLNSTIETSQWVISAYLLALALMLPINGWLVDRVGTKKLYLSCFSLFTLASFLCGAAHTMPQLICARIAQGMAGGLLAPLTHLMMARVAGKQMVKVLGVAAAPILLAPLAGPILAGAILRYAGWPWLFYINLPVGILAIALAFAILPSDGPSEQRRPFDFAGFALISPGLVCLLYGFESTSHHRSGGIETLIVGALLLAAFVRYAVRNETRALVDIRLFKTPVFSFAAITQFLSNGILYAGQFLIPLFLIVGCGLDASSAGWVLSAMGIGMLCVYPFVGKLTDRFGIRKVASGGVIVNFIGTVPFLVMGYCGYSLPVAVLALLLRGMGQGSTGLPSLAAAYASIPREKLSSATTAINVVQRLGGPIVTTTLAIFVSAHASVHESTEATRSFAVPLIALIAFQLLVFFSASKLPVRINENK